MNDNDNKATCPICGKSSEEKWAPFCSNRCSQIDLHRWLSGSYAVPTEERPEDESSES